METTAGPGFDARTAGRRDQLQTLAYADGLPVTYQPFKFESRRSRIDWRLLHGVDINKLIRDTDLDTLERLVGCLAWGDIEAEDSRHLSEASFVKVFRLAQLLLEYLLYVQDSLKHTNSVLEELLLQSQMTELTERLAVAGSEAERLRNEREELCYQQQHQEEQQLLLMEVGKLEGQMQQLQTENAELRQQLMQKSSVDFTATNEVTAGLQAQLDGKIRELLQLQSELRQSETSMAVFKQANETLKQQLDALQKQLNSPEAATPSFVAKQRTRLAAAESKAEKAEAQAQQLQVENLQLVKQVTSLQQELQDLERLNAQLERQAAKARNLGLAASLESGGRSGSPSPLGQQHHLAAAAAARWAEESAATAQRPQQQNASVRHDGAISREAAQELKALVAAMADKPAEQIAADYAEALIDWETPFKLEPEEDAQFGELLPLEMPGRPGLLMAAQHNPQELAANQGRLLASINRQLDQQVASFGIHPGRTGLSNQEVVAAMQMLSERRQALEASLPEEQRLLVDMARVGLVFNCYNGLQGVLQQQPQGADGKQHLPGPVAPLLVSEVQPPASMLPVGPPSVRVAAGAGPRSMPGAPGNRGMLPSSFTNAASPAASSRYGAFAAPTSEDEASSPQRIPYQSVAMTPGSGSRPDIAAALLQATSPHSPASAGPLSSGPAVMASRTASYTAAAYRAGAVNTSGSGRSSPEVSQAAISTALSSGGFSPMSAALHVKQQLGLSPRGSASPAAPAEGINVIAIADACVRHCFT
ncbi:hypothetical protein OEZ85_011438 [Tetradesmus obliquus]|uniref:Cilium assembly protein DZIP1 N-terminal domain-containing protein n=1 Tax=Tetradesmus obliquus TaxID=3088 RepID=A0ABY8TQQ2_TETOB|nr:hypothetical protein OEZ85_011438 [Tetradesmus obliquus]